MHAEETIRIYIGYDKKESVALPVLMHSIMRHSSVPIAVTPIHLDNLKHCYWRNRDPKASTDFSFSRFLTPYLAGYKGYALWMDCDMLCRGDMAELWDKHRCMFDAVQVVKHNYTPAHSIKFLGYEQHKYPKKNWSSVMLFNCGHSQTRHLTPEYVNTATGLELHQFKWVDDDRVGELPREWNHLVGEYPFDPNAKLVHFTVGGPYFNEYQNCDYSEEWFDEYQRVMHADQLFVPRLRVSQK